MQVNNIFKHFKSFTKYVLDTFAAILIFPKSSSITYASCIKTMGCECLFECACTIVGVAN